MDNPRNAALPGAERLGNFLLRFSGRVSPPHLGSNLRCDPVPVIFRAASAALGECRPQRVFLRRKPLEIFNAVVSWVEVDVVAVFSGERGANKGRQDQAVNKLSVVVPASPYPDREVATGSARGKNLLFDLSRPAADCNAASDGPNSSEIRGFIPTFKSRNLSPNLNGGCHGA